MFLIIIVFFTLFYNIFVASLMLHNRLNIFGSCVSLTIIVA